MKVDLSRVQQASALASDVSDDSDRDLPPEWDSRQESFDDYYERAYAYTNRDQEASPSPLPSPFLRPHERAPVRNYEPIAEGMF
jgi:hypothetical protein